MKYTGFQGITMFSILKKYFGFLAFFLIGIITLYSFVFSSNAFCYLDFCHNQAFDFLKELSLRLNSFNLSLGSIIYLPIRFFSSLSSGYSNTLYFLLLFILGGFWFYKNYKEGDKLGIAALFGILLVFNPFVYERIMMGQWGVVASTLLMPIFIYYMFKYFKEPNNHNLIWLVIGFMASSVHQLHFFVINLGILFLYILILLFKERFKQIPSITILKNTIKVLGILFLINLYWVLPYIFTQLQTQNTGIIGAIDESDMLFFAPKTSVVNSLINTAGMYGSWRENSIILAKNILPLPVWLGILIIFIFLMIRGFLTDPKKPENILFILLFIIGLIFAVGMASQYTAPIFEWFFDNVPFFKGFRDSNKFVSLIVISYAILGAKGLKSIIDENKDRIHNLKLRKAFGPILVLIMLSLIIIYNFPQIGLWGQLHPISYPESYSELNTYLKNIDETGHVMYLPLGTYFTYNWSKPAGLDGRIGNPINRVVEKFIITGSNEQDYGAKNELQTNLEVCLKNKNISCLEEQGIQYIILDDCAHFPDKYQWIRDNLNKTHKDGCTEVYKTNTIVKVDKDLEIPLSFIIGSIISIITLLYLIFILRK
ncbi:MAG: hypothetical protein WC356_05230 [Candidatus Micrarchaeia archaeon]|jgi:hypothetical protein